MHVLDELMENLSYWAKYLLLSNDDQSWIKHIPNLMVARRCFNFASNEHGKFLLGFECATQNDASPVVASDYNAHCIASKSILEESLLSELVVELFDEEIEVREFNVKVEESNIDFDYQTKNE